MATKNHRNNEPIEKQLWLAADKLRKNIDAAEYKHIVLGLIFIKYISDAFEELYAKLKAGEGEYAGADPEDQDEYLAKNIFFVPDKARWSYLQSRAKQTNIGKEVDAAMEVIEKNNPLLKGVLPKVFARANLDPTNLGGLIDLVSNIALNDAKARSADILGHVYEYFLGEFALAEGKQGGQFYTPKSIVQLLVEMLEPYKGRVLDPCCGSGGLFVQSETFIKEHQGNVNDISIYGQESNQTTWRLAKMNLAIRGIDSSQVKWNNEGSFLNDKDGNLTWFKNFNGLSSVLVYCWLKSAIGKEQLNSITIGSSQAALTISGMKKLVLTIPSLKKRHKLECQIDYIYEKIASNQLTIQTLSKLRDTLLPKLMSGEVRVQT